MATVRVFNVKHGDLIFLGLDNNILITRDFGSLDSGINFNWTNNLPKYLHCCHPYLDGINPNCHREAILTHPHSDHYSGYQIMHNLGYRNYFDRAYVPYLDLGTISSKPSFHSLQLKTALCFISVMPLQKTQKVQEWIMIAPLMRDLSKHLIGVYTGCTAFNHWQPQGTVIWPPMPTDVYYQKKYKKLIDMLDIFSCNVRDCADSIYGELSDILTTLFDPDEFFYGYGDNERDVSDYLIAEEGPKNDKSSKVITLLGQIAGQFSYENNEHIEKYYKSFGSLIDDHSVAFSIGDSNDKRALFLSDFHDSAMNRMVHFMTTPDYEFLKSAHHGTRLGDKLEKFLSTNPLAKEVIHCCGPSNNPNYYGPSQRYSNLAHNTYCTDWNRSSIRWVWNPKYKLFNQLFQDFRL